MIPNSPKPKYTGLQSITKHQRLPKITQDGPEMASCPGPPHKVLIPDYTAHTAPHHLSSCCGAVHAGERVANVSWLSAPQTAPQEMRGHLWRVVRRPWQTRSYHLLAWRLFSWTKFAPGVLFGDKSFS